MCDIHSNTDLRPHNVQRNDNSFAKKTLLDSRKNKRNITERNTLVESNIRIVEVIAKTYQGLGLSIEDLVSEGILGLIRAAELYDYEFGVAFSTYASYWIKDAIRIALTNTSHLIRIPVYMSRVIHSLYSYKEDFDNKYHRNHTLHEIADFITLSKSKKSHLHSAIQTRKKYSSIVSNAISESQLNCFRYEYHTDLIERDEILTILNKNLSCLSDIELLVLTFRFGLSNQDCLSFKRIASSIGTSREMVKKIERTALMKLHIAMRICSP